MKAKFASQITTVAAALFTVLTTLGARGDGIDTTDPNLPPLYPSGEYRTPSQVFAMYHGPGLAITFSDVHLQPFSRLNHNSGPNEIEDFNLSVPGMISVNGSPNQPGNGNGPGESEAFGKAGNTTGTFSTEMLSLNLSGSSPFGPYMLRESPTLVSTGQTSITAIGGGLFHIDSFFDVFTELSVDGGNTWIPSDTSAHIVLEPVPEPSVCAFAGLAIAALVLRRRR